MSENNIVNSNAEGQEVENVEATSTETPAATTNVPEHEEVSQTENAKDADSQAENVESTHTQSTAATIDVPAHEEVPETVAAHDDFDWSVDKRNVSQYSSDEKKKYDKVYEDTFVKIEDREIMNGLIVGLTKTDAVINIGFKSDGLISLNEFRDLANVKVGDEVEVMVVEKEDRDGQPASQP